MRRELRRFLRRARIIVSRVFIQGLIAILPIAITVSILYWLTATAEHILGGLVRILIPDWKYWTGLGVLLGIALVFLAGLMMNAWVTRRLLARAEAAVERIPVVKSIYVGIRDLAEFFSRKGAKGGFRQVVAVPLGNMRLVGFVTLSDADDLPPELRSPDDIIGVYLPMSYQIGGFTVYLPRSAVEPMEMSVEEAMRFTLTAGMSSTSSATPDTPPG